jgi:asparagine synthase (glutamine-hydrolysing)
VTAVFGLMRLDGADADPAQLAGMARALGAPDPRRRGVWTGAGAGLGTAGAPAPAPAPDRGRIASAPIVSEDGNLVLVGYGYVDDRRRLAATLRIPATEAGGLSVSALILRAYEHSGARCLDQLVGDFTFVLWNRRTRRLTAGASAPMSRPLYYHASPRVLAFASLARGLFSLPHIDRRVDEARIAGFLTGADTGRHRTTFRDVKRLLPGELLTADTRGVRVTRWWQPDLTRRLELGSDEDYVEALSSILGQVIDDHLSSSGRTGMLLSGGLDSGAVAAVAAPLLDGSGRRLAAYTEVPRRGFSGHVAEGRYSDETPFVRALAAAYDNIDLSLIEDCRRGILEGADRCFDAAEIPIRNAANRGWIEEIYQRAHDENVQTLLNGDHGNLTVSWNGGGLLPSLIARRRIAPALREARAIATATGRSTSRVILSSGVRPLLPAGMTCAIDRLRGDGEVRLASRYQAGSLIAPAFAAELELSEREAPSPRRDSEGRGRGRRLDVLLAGAGRTAEIYAGFRRIYGIDTRVPLADRRLVEFCLQVPEDQFGRVGEERLLIRRAMAGKLPARTLDSKQRGVQAAYWFERMSEERPQLLAAVRGFESDALTSRVLDLPRLRSLLERWPDRAPTSAPEITLYRGAIATAMMTGAFLSWAQHGPASPTPGNGSS